MSVYHACKLDGMGVNVKNLTFVAAGAVSMDTNLLVGGSTSIVGASCLAGSMSSGGGYGNTGVTITDAGALCINNALGFDGTSTLSGSVSVGGVYGNTGVTIMIQLWSTHLQL
jgi:hypothetical protein